MTKLLLSVFLTSAPRSNLSQTMWFENVFYWIHY